MKIIVSKDTVKLNENHSENHYGEYNVNECIFEFDEYFDSVPIKKAIFTSQSNNKSFEIDIINNKCTIPHEVLTKVYDTVILGVYGYDVNNDELLIRYSPTPDSFIVHDGSYRENAEKPEIITPSQYDMYSQALQEGLAEVDERLDDIEKQGDYASEQGNYAKEQGDYAKEQGTNAKNIAEETEKKAEDGLFNGKSLEFVWQGTKLGVRLEGQEEYQFVDLQGVQGEIGATGEPFKIKKTYGSVSEMNADFGNMVFGDYVMIASSVEVEDNAKLYTRGESAWIFISDFSGAMGIRGETGLTPNIKIGEVKTLEAGSQAKVTRSGSNEEPVFNFEIPKGDKGDDYVLTEEDKVEIGEKVNTEYEERIAENEKDIVDIESYLDNLTPKSSASGELVHITDALGLPTFETKTSGNVEQFTTSGKQLFDYASNRTSIGSGITTDKEGWITSTYDNSSGTSNYYDNLFTAVSELLKPSTKYTIVMETKDFDGTLSSVSFVSTSPNDLSQFVYGYSVAFAGLTKNSVIVQQIKTIDDFTNAKHMLRSFVTYGPGTKGSITFRLSVLEDTTVTPETFVYEPYTGGQASPNPEYPQEIEVLEAYNLLCNNIETQTINGLEVTKNKDGSTTVNGTATQDTSIYVSHSSTKEKLSLDAADYYMNGCPSGGSASTYRIMLYDKSWAYISQDTGNGTNFTLNEYKENCIVTINVIKGATLDNLVFKPQIVKGKFGKPYLPYGCVGYKVNGKNLCKLKYNNMLTNVSGTVVATPYPSVIVDTRNISSLYVSGDFTLLDGSLIRAGGYNEYPHINLTGTRFNINSNGVINVSNYNYVLLQFTWTGSISTDIEKAIENSFMISYENLPYEPYQEQIVPLDLKGNFVGKINENIKDYLVTDKKKLWLVKNTKIKEYTANDVTKMTFLTYDNIDYARFAKPTDLMGYGSTAFNIKVLCDKAYYKNVGEVFPSKDNIGRILLTPEGNYFWIGFPKGTTEEEMKEKLSNFKVLYQLATPEPIELGELPEPIKTFEGVNNIQVLANLDTEIEVKYALDLKKYYDNKLAEISAQII